MPHWSDIAAGIRSRLLYLAERYRDDRCRDTAAALTYVSLFALVPLLTVLYTMASVIPAFQGLEANIQQLLFENLVPETSAGLQEYLEDFSRQARNLTGFGVAFLIGTAILMLSYIEQAFNNIWRTRGNRGLIASFLLYWAVLSLTPVTIGLGLAVSAWLAAAADLLGRWDIIGAGAVFVRLLPYLLQILGFTLIYAAVPNCRVPLKHALIGGAVAAISFNIARALFTKLVAGSSITFIYGAFAAVPLFLLWIYISWNIVLLSAVVVHSLSAYRGDVQAQRPALLKALEVLQVLWQRQGEGRSVGELELLGRGPLVLDSESWQWLRDLLLSKRVITQDERGRYLLARDLHTVRVAELLEWVGGDTQVPAEDRGLPAWEQRAVNLLRQRYARDRELFDLSIAGLFSQ